MIVGMMRPPAGVDKYYFHTAMHKRMADGLRNRGVNVVEFSLNDWDHLAVLTKLRNRNDSIIYLGHKYDQLVDLYTGDDVSLTQWLGRPSVGSLGDHPFSAYRLKKIMGMPSNVHLVGREPGFRNALSCIRPEYKNFRVIDFLPSTDLTSVRQKPYAERNIDLLVAMDFRTTFPSLSEVAADCADLGLDKRLTTYYFDAALSDVKTYPFELFERVFSSLHSIGLRDLHASQNVLFLNVMLILHKLDMIVRGQRRKNLLNSLKPEEMPGKIVILAKHTVGLPEKPNIEYLGPVRYSYYIELLRDSRLHLFANPTYPNVINERIPVSLQAGCAVVCDSNPALEKLPVGEAVFSKQGEATLADIARPLSVDFDDRIHQSTQRIAQYQTKIEVLHDLFNLLLESHSTA